MTTAATNNFSNSNAMYSLKKQSSKRSLSMYLDSEDLDESNTSLTYKAEEDDDDDHFVVKEKKHPLARAQRPSLRRMGSSRLGSRRFLMVSTPDEPTENHQNQQEQSQDKADARPSLGRMRGFRRLTTVSLLDTSVSESSSNDLEDFNDKEESTAGHIQPCAPSATRTSPRGRPSLCSMGRSRGFRRLDSTKCLSTDFLNAGIRGHIATLNARAQELLENVRVHATKAEARYSSGNTRGAVLSMRKVKKLEKEHVNVLSALFFLHPLEQKMVDEIALQELEQKKKLQEQEQLHTQKRRCTSFSFSLSSRCLVNDDGKYKHDNQSLLDLSKLTEIRTQVNEILNRAQEFQKGPGLEHSDEQLLAELALLSC